MCTRMSTKTITITEDAYRQLRALKRADESFSDVIRRLTTDDIDPMAFAGSCTGEVPGAAELAAAFDDDIEQHTDDLAR